MSYHVTLHCIIKVVAQSSGDRAGAAGAHERGAGGVTTITSIKYYYYELLSYRICY